jgi:AraC-like DNA-binding protein
MIVKDILPSEPLKTYIQQYRLRHFIFKNGVTPTVKPFPPRPEQCLTFYVRGHETARYTNDRPEFKKPRSVISGQFTTRVDRYVSYPEVLMIIVDFKPGALHRLINMPFAEFADKDLDAETVLSPEIRRVNDRLNSAACYSEMIGIIECFFKDLIKQSKEYHIIDQMFSVIIKDPNYSIDWIAKNTCLSTRQLERQFHEKIGISPKAFVRVARFNQSYWMHLKNPKLSWFQIAIACGYTDYQHLVKEYKQFANTTPNHFFIEESTAPGRILGLNKYE